jgi:hypothetical protein
MSKVGTIYVREKFEDTKGVTRSRKSKKKKQHNDKKKKD